MLLKLCDIIYTRGGGDPCQREGIKPIAQNRKAHDYFIEDTYECGIAYTEVKSIRGERSI